MTCHGTLKVNERKADPVIFRDVKWNQEIKRTRRTWNDLEKTALDRRAWKDVFVDLCVQRPNGEEELVF
jgi:hypothetical protein